jgi:hypothetical protein
MKREGEIAKLNGTHSESRTGEGKDAFTGCHHFVLFARIYLTLCKHWELNQ